MPFVNKTLKQMKTKGRKLTELQVRFVNEYMVDFVGAHAVLRAGYKTTTQNAPKIAAQLMNNPLVMEGIDKARAKMEKKTEVTVDYVIQKLMSIAEATETENPQAALRGLELLGKYLAMFRERQEISGPDGQAIEMEQRVKENVADFTNKIARLASISGGKKD